MLKYLIWEKIMKSIQDYLSIIDNVIEKGKFKDNWESLSEFKMPSWYRKGRFGLFVHWGFILCLLSVMSGIQDVCI